MCYSLLAAFKSVLSVPWAPRSGASFPLVRAHVWQRPQAQSSPLPPGAHAWPWEAFGAHTGGVYVWRAWGRFRRRRPSVVGLVVGCKQGTRDARRFEPMHCCIPGAVTAAPSPCPAGDTQQALTASAPNHH